MVETPPHAVDPASAVPFHLAPSDRIATAGSCFAQHIARYLPKLGLTYYIAERGPQRLSEPERQERQYGTFSARYGNIYTTRQMLQLLQRAFGEFTPLADHWEMGDRTEGFVDPFRPTIEPNGFSSLAEMHWDRAHHLRAVRDLVSSADVFVFTLGLTEGWIDRRDDAVFPSCPGCGSGTYDPDLHAFKNFGVAEVTEDLERACRYMRSKNPSIRVILTVSPVPLVATMSGNHVLASTVYSKSVLRVAAEAVSNALDYCCYFPSFEIVTGPHARGTYFRDDLRTITDHGVDHVMRCFLKAFVQGDGRREEHGHPVVADKQASSRPSTPSITQIVCDEETLANRYAGSKTYGIE